MAKIEGYYADPGRRTPAYNQGGNSGQTRNTTGSGTSNPIPQNTSNWIPTGNKAVDAAGQARAEAANWWTSHQPTANSYWEKNQNLLGSRSFGIDSTQQPPYSPTNNPGGGDAAWRGGGGTAPAGIDQQTFDWLISQYGKRKPNQYTWNDLEYADQVPAPFREFNNEMYDQQRVGVDEGFAAARGRGGAAFDRGLAEIDAYENPYLQGPRQQTPGTSPALQRSMQAWGGAGSDAAAEEARFGFEMDQGMGSVYDLLGRAEDSYTQGLRRGNAGDRMEFDQRLGQEERMMDLFINQAETKAKSQHEIDEFNYGKEYADKNYDKNMQIAMANHTGQNQISQANTQLGNQWNTDIMALLQQLGMGGMNGAGKQTLDLGDYPNLIA